MRIWSKEHTFDHPWHTVVNAALRKYPNPVNDNVLGIDVLSQQVRDGRLHNERILQTKFAVMNWARKLANFGDKMQYSLEYSVVDPGEREMRLNTRNLSCTNLLRVDENLVYKAHPTDPNKTVLRQWTSVSVNLPMLASYSEKAFLSLYGDNASKGPQALQWVIDQMPREEERPTRSAARRRRNSSSSGGGSDEWGGGGRRGDKLFGGFDEKIFTAVNQCFSPLFS